MLNEHSPGIAGKDDMRREPKVSVLIVSYNQERFVEEALLGALDQEYGNLEVVISDDGSTDSTPDIIRKIAGNYGSRLVPILNPDNVGITRNCNRALRRCRGELITTLGGDDVMLPGKIAAQVEWFQQSEKRVLCGHLVESIEADGSRSPSQEAVNPNAKGIGPLNYLHRRDMLHCTSTMMRASAIPEHGFDESIPIASDFMFWVEILMTNGEYGCVNGHYAKRRNHDGNVTRDQAKMFADLELTYRLIADRYPQYRKVCHKVIAEHVDYYFGVTNLRWGKVSDARGLFLKSLRQDPFFMKSWIRLFQSYCARSLK